MASSNTVELRADSRIAELPMQHCAVRAEMCVRDVGRLFDERPTLIGVTVYDEASFIGLISQRAFTLQMCKPRYQETYNDKSVRTLLGTMNVRAIRLPHDTPIYEAVLAALERSEDIRYEPIIVEDVEGNLQLLDTCTLLLSQSRQLQAQNQAHEKTLADLQEAEDRYHSIFENAVEGIFRTSPAGHYLDANPTLARLYGYESAHELMHSVNDIASQLYVDPDRRRQFIELMDRNQIVRNFESEIRQKDGTRIWIRENVRAFRDEAGVLLHYEGTVEDITERMQKEAYRKARDAAEAANLAKTEFLANMSHEIRTPLHGILSFAGFGIKKAHTAEPHKLLEYFQKIDTSGHRLLSLVNNLLDLSKLEAGKMNFEFQSHDLVTIIAGVEDEFLSLLSDRNINFKFERPKQAVVADVDQTRIMQVVRNLINNAVKFSPQHGHIELSVYGGGERAIVTIRDYGIGIPEAELGVIFDKFVQSSKTKSGAGGTGLGLAICREIMNGHNGRIWAANAPGGGAIFTVELPLRQPATQPSNVTSEIAA